MEERKEGLKERKKETRERNERKKRTVGPEISREVTPVASSPPFQQQSLRVEITGALFGLLWANVSRVEEGFNTQSLKSLGNPEENRDPETAHPFFLLKK